MSVAKSNVAEDKVGMLKNPSPGNELSCRDVLTLLLWVGCLAIGLAGFAFEYPRPHPAVKDVETVHAEMLDVQLTPDTQEMVEPESTAVLSPNPPPVAPALEPAKIPSAPAMAAVEVAAPSAPVAFALPVQGPVRVVEAAKASFSTPAAESRPVVSAAPAVQTLILGSGEGRQPAPYYPAQAQRAGQEGTVRISLSVDEGGKVVNADVAAPCPWALLNQAALKVVKERWRFPAGPFRLYEVAIRFELSK